MECEDCGDIAANETDAVSASQLPPSPASLCTHMQPSPPHVIVDDSPLQRQMLRNKQSLKVKLMTRRPMNDLVDQGIFPSLNASPALFEHRRRLARAKTGDRLRAKIARRPERHELIQQHILLEDTGGLVDPLLMERRLKLKRARLADTLNDQLSHRPGPLELIRANILHTDEGVEKAVKEGAINFQPTCQGDVRHKASPAVFYLDDSSSSSSSSSFTAVDEGSSNSAAASPTEKHAPVVGLQYLSGSQSTLPACSAESVFTRSLLVSGENIGAVSITSSLTSVTGSLTSITSSSTSVTSSLNSVTGSLTSITSSSTSVTSSLNSVTGSLTSITSSSTSVSSSLNSKTSSLTSTVNTLPSLKRASLSSLAISGRVAPVSTSLLSTHGLSSSRAPVLLVSPSAPNLSTVPALETVWSRVGTCSSQSVVFSAAAGGVSGEVPPATQKQKLQKERRRHSATAVNSFVTTPYIGLESSTVTVPASTTISAPTTAISAPVVSEFCSDSMTSQHRQAVSAARDKKKKKHVAVSGSVMTSSVSARASGNSVKTKTIKFHEYKGPPSATRVDSSTVPPPPPLAAPGSVSGGEPGAGGDGESSYHLLLRQQQLFLQWQLEWSHKYPQILLPANKKPPTMTSSSTASSANNANNINNNAVRYTVVSSVGCNGQQQQQQKMCSKPSVGRLIDRYTARLEAMRVSALRVELKQRSLPVSGSKSQLVERLRPFAAEILSPPASNVSTDVSAPLSVTSLGESASADSATLVMSSADVVSSRAETISTEIGAGDGDRILAGAVSLTSVNHHGESVLYSDVSLPSDLVHGESVLSSGVSLTSDLVGGDPMLASEVEMTSVPAVSCSAGSSDGVNGDGISDLPPSEMIKMETIDSQPMSVMSCCNVTSPPSIESDWSLDVMSNVIGCDSTNHTSLSPTDMGYPMISESLTDCPLTTSAATTTPQTVCPITSDTGLFDSVSDLADYSLADVDQSLLSPLAENGSLFNGPVSRDDNNVTMSVANTASALFNGCESSSTLSHVTEPVSVTSSTSQPISAQEIDSSTGDTVYDCINDVNNTQLAIQHQLQRVQQLQQQLEQSQLILQQQQRIFRLQSEQQQQQQQQFQQLQQQPSMKRGLVKQHIEQKLTAQQLQQQLNTLHKLQTLQQTYQSGHGTQRADMSGKLSTNNSVTAQQRMTESEPEQFPQTDARWQSCSTVTSSSKVDQSECFSHSQDIDDVLDILINNGELPASAAKVPPLSPLPSNTPWLDRSCHLPQSESAATCLATSSLLSHCLRADSPSISSSSAHLTTCTPVISRNGHYIDYTTSGSSSNVSALTMCGQLLVPSSAAAASAWIPCNGDSHNSYDPLLSQNSRPPQSAATSCEFMDFTI